VTQQVAANSEQAASSAEELSSQAEEMRGLVSTFQLSDAGESVKPAQKGRTPAKA